MTDTIEADKFLTKEIGEQIANGKKLIMIMKQKNDTMRFEIFLK